MYYACSLLVNRFIIQSNLSTCLSRFEKLFAGHYAGDLFRLVLLKLTEEGIILDGKVTQKLKTWGSVTCENVSDVERFVHIKFIQLSQPKLSDIKS